MASIRKETNRHIWRETILKIGSDNVEGVICMNCRKPLYDRDADRPVTGCLSGVDVSRCGESRLKDHAEQEMRRRKVLEDDERVADEDLLRQAGVIG
jgi:hypothetical protein